jgi:hypothetical protein
MMSFRVATSVFIELEMNELAEGVEGSGLKDQGHMRGWDVEWMWFLSNFQFLCLDVVIVSHSFFANVVPLYLCVESVWSQVFALVNVWLSAISSVAKFSISIERRKGSTQCVHIICYLPELWLR